jgi:mRNA interferase MazF
MKRGEVVIVAATGDHGRPAVIVQTDAFPESHASVVICRMTSEIVDAPDFRITVDPNEANGLRVRSQIMADKPAAVRRNGSDNLSAASTRTISGASIYPSPSSWGSRTDHRL